METKIIPIVYNGAESKVTIKKLTFGELNEIQNQAIPIKIVGKNTQVSIDQKILKEMSLSKSLVNAPFTIDIPTIRNIDSQLGEMLWKEVNEFNNIQDQKK